MRSRGFTLIEMLVVLAIMGLLAAAARPLLSLSVQRAKEAELRHALRTLRSGIDAYKRAVEQGQVTMTGEGTAYPPTLAALVDGVPDLRSSLQGKRLYFLRRLPRDPFADPALPAAQGWGLRASDTPADNPSAGKDVFDVHSLSEGRALDGTLYKDW
jgi:general secretion pathway protein G